MLSWMIRSLLLCTALLGAAPAQAQQLATAPEIKDIPGVVLRFASEERSRELLAQDDAWIAAMSDFMRGAILQTREPRTNAQLRSALAQWAVAWTPEEMRASTEALRSIAPQLARLKLPLPPVVELVRTAGTHPADRAPYTRGAAIFLPRGLPQGPGYSEAGLMAHELFHIASRHQPAWSERLYALIGFAPVPELSWPAALQARRIVNPDAPHHRHQMTLELDGRSVNVMPLTVASRTQLDFDKRESFFDVLDVVLLEVEQVQGRTQAVMREGQPALLAPAQWSAYLQRLGGNTSYVIHPEETIADNVMLIVTQTPARNAGLQRRLEALLLAP